MMNKWSHIDEAVYHNLEALLGEGGGPATPKALSRHFKIRFGSEWPSLEEISSSLGFLEVEGYIERAGRGYILSSPSRHFRLLLDFPEAQAAEEKVRPGFMPALGGGVGIEDKAEDVLSLMPYRPSEEEVLGSLGAQEKRWKGFTW